MATDGRTEREQETREATVEHIGDARLQITMLMSSMQDQMDALKAIRAKLPSADLDPATFDPAWVAASMVEVWESLRKADHDDWLTVAGRVVAKVASDVSEAGFLAAELAKGE